MYFDIIIVCVCVYVCMCIYIYREREREREPTTLFYLLRPLETTPPASIPKPWSLRPDPEDHPPEGFRV